MDPLALIQIMVSAREKAGVLSLLRPLQVGVGVIPDRVATRATPVELADDGLMDLVEPSRITCGSGKAKQVPSSDQEPN